MSEHDPPEMFVLPKGIGKRAQAIGALTPPYLAGGEGGAPPPPPPEPPTTAGEEDEPFHLVPLDWDAIRAQGVPEVEYLGADLYLPMRKRIWAVGAGESGKSIWAAHKAVQLTHAGLVVVYVSQENGLEEEVRRFLRLVPEFDLLHLCVDQGLDLLLAEHVAALLDYAAEWRASLVVLDTFTACWAGDDSDNHALAAFDRTVMKPVVSLGASILVLDHTGNPQQFVKRRGVSAPRGASAKGQKTDHLIEFHDLGACEFKLVQGKSRGVGHKQPVRTYRVVDTEDGLLDVVETEGAAGTDRCADALVEAIYEAGQVNSTAELRAMSRELGFGTETTSEAIKFLEAEEPPRVRVAWDTVLTEGGKQRAKVWRPAAAREEYAQEGIDF